MYFYKSNLQSSKPSGLEFKTEMAGVSVVITLREGQKVDTFNTFWGSQ